MQHLGEFRPTNPFNFQINFQMHCISLLHKISSSFSRFHLQFFLWIESFPPVNHSSLSLNFTFNFGLINAKSTELTF